MVERRQILVPELLGRPAEVAVDVGVEDPSRKDVVHGARAHADVAQHHYPRAFSYAPAPRSDRGCLKNSLIGSSNIREVSNYFSFPFPSTQTDRRAGR